MSQRSLMNFRLRYFATISLVWSGAELVTLGPGLRPERRFAPLARGLNIIAQRTSRCRKDYSLQRKLSLIDNLVKINIERSHGRSRLYA